MTDFETHPDFDSPWSTYDWVAGFLVCALCIAAMPAILVWSIISGYLKGKQIDRQLRQKAALKEKQTTKENHEKPTHK